MKKTVVAGFCLFALFSLELAADGERSGSGLPDGANVFTVGPDGECKTIAEAVEAARKAKGAREIVLANGVCRIDRTLELDKRDVGLVIRAAEPGKAVVSGSIPVTGWRKAEGTPWLLCADIPQAKEGFFFRSLVVGGEPAPRSEFPGGGKQLQNTNEWKVRWLSSVGNGWERQPTRDEYTLMYVKKGDLPDGMDFASADMRVYHEWDNSLVRVESYDTEGLVVRLAEECRFPPGSFKRHGYVVYNVKEGMKEPGQWHLDCREGRLYYWPKPGEEEAMPSVEVPRTETLLRLKDVDGLKIDGVVFENAKPPMKRASFGGMGIDAAVMGQGGANVVFARVAFRNNGGLGLILQGQKDFRLVDSHFEKNGSCSVQIGGAGGEIRGNRFLDSGQVFTSACAVYLGGREIVFAENEIAGAPYCGVCYGGSRHLFESNRVSRVMQSLHDGGAFYGMSAECVFRGNRVTDNQPGASSRHAFYYDEGSHDGLVVDNYVEGGFQTVVHNHMTRNIVISNNVFKTPGDMSVSFSRSRDGVFVANELHIGGKIARLPDATSLAKWEGNRIYVQGALTNAVPVVKRLGRQPDPVKVSRTDKAPAFDGFFDAACWPGIWHTANRGRDREDEGGAPHLFRACHDGTNLYLAVRIARFNHEEWRTNRTEGADSAVFRFPGLEVKGWADGSSENAAAFFGGREKEQKRGFGKNVFFAFKIPFERIFPTGQAPRTLPFNCEIYDAQYGERRYWDSPAYGELAGTLAFEDLGEPRWLDITCETHRPRLLRLSPTK